MLTSVLFGAQFYVSDKEQTKKDASWAVIPYAFDAESTGLTGGVAAIFSDVLQPQTHLVVTLYGGEKLDVYKELTPSIVNQEQAYTQGWFVGFGGYKVPGTKRVFVTLLASHTYYPNQLIYVDGSHQSQKNLSDTRSATPLRTQGTCDWGTLTFEYVLPLGESKKDPLPHIVLDEGIAINRDDVGGGDVFTSGQTLVGTELFYEKVQADRLANRPKIATNGVRLYLQHNNTDYPDNPSRGYSFKLKGSVDFGGGASTQSWNSIEASYSHYISLTQFSWTRYNVLALNLWSAYSPSWERDESNETVLDPHRPPMWEGAKLGGYTRMRGYDSNRFSDKAALYGALEWRFIPTYNPLRNKEWLPIAIDWFEGVMFVEAGRVNKRYNLAELTQDMKYDVGFSLRALAAKLPIRFDIAYGDEGTTMWVMIQQPF